MNTLVIPKFITRDFSLIVVEIWGRSYVRMFGEKTKTVPRNVFLIRRGVVMNYRNPLINRELNSTLLRNLAKDPNYLRTLFASYTRRNRELQRYFKKTLPMGEFLRYLRVLQEAWPGFYVSIYPYADPRFSSVQKRQLKAFRLKTEAFLHEAYDVVDRALQELYPHLGALARLISIDELESGKAPERSRLAQRAKETLVLVDGFLLTKREFGLLTKKHNFTLEREVSRLSERQLKGVVAHRGVAKGRVRVLMRLGDISKVEFGDVIVSPMTVPAFLPAIVKAAALVTDEGGITSHAAIVARELQKPCIIGTKIATKVLKDGDMVEVDAEKGVVKIIKQAQ